MNLFWYCVAIRRPSTLLDDVLYSLTFFAQNINGDVK